MKARDILIALAVKFNGNWHAIFENLQNKKFTPSEQEIQDLKSKLGGVEAITMLDEEYPETLRNAIRPPFVLFYKGDISLLKSENIFTFYGKRGDYSDPQNVYNAIEKITIGLKETDSVILTGGSKGVATSLIELSLAQGTKNIVVMVSGLNQPYPTENKQLFEEVVAKGGLLISEYLPDTLPERNNFPERMRIMAMLGKKTIVVDASRMSGTAVGVQFALSYGKDILVVPGPAFEDSLNHALLKEGAIPFVSTSQLFE